MGRRTRTPDGPAGRKLKLLLGALREGKAPDAVRHFTGLVKVFGNRAAALDAVQTADPKLRVVLEEMLAPKREDSPVPAR